MNEKVAGGAFQRGIAGPGFFLLRLTSRPFRPQRDASGRLRPWIEQLVMEGWTLRQCGPRNYDIWRRSLLAATDTLPVAVVPSRFCPMPAIARDTLLAFDLQRQITRRALVGEGRPPGDVDEPATVLSLLREAAAHALSSGEDWARCRELVCQAEIELLSAAAGWPIREPETIEALLPHPLRAAHLPED